jgi:Delta3-Delta2-enoyl-CoA isomerase
MGGTDGLAGSGVLWSVEDGIAIVRLSRPHGNAINAGLLEGLAEAFSRAEADTGVHGVLLASAGKIFCPGLDLQELLALERPAMQALMDLLGDCLRRMFIFPKPVVAALSGHALAGGCVLGLAADWRVLRRGALIGLNEIRVGVPLPFGVARVLRASIPPSRLHEVALLGRNFSDEEAVTAGLAHELHEAEGFEAHCRARLLEHAGRDPAAYGATKRALRGDVAAVMEAEDRSHTPEFLDCWFSAGTRRRIEAIVADLKSRG